MARDGCSDDVEDEYARFRRRQRVHRMHLVGYVVSGALILIGMLLFGTDWANRPDTVREVLACLCVCSDWDLSIEFWLAAFGVGGL